MNPRAVFCPNEACPARGKTGEENQVVIHSRKKGRYKCTCCDKMFNERERTGTANARLRKPHKKRGQVVTLFAHGCPPQVILKAIERLNATFRERLDILTHRCRHAARQVSMVELGMWLLGYVYNFCSFHHSLRVANFDQPDLPRWIQRTPTMAAGLTDLHMSLPARI